MDKNYGHICLKLLNNKTEIYNNVFTVIRLIDDTFHMICTSKLESKEAYKTLASDGENAL
jgi:hypothetical protein